MMQNVNSDNVTELKTIEIEQNCGSNSGGTALATGKPSLVESSNFSPDIMSGSEDDEASVSEVWTHEFVFKSDIKLSLHHISSLTDEFSIVN